MAKALPMTRQLHLGPSRQVFELFWTFSHIGPFTFGGGYAMIPVLEKEAVTKRGWVKREELADVLAVSSSIPGAVAVNAAAFVGYRVAGVRGAISATIGIVLPAFLLMLLLAVSFVHLHEHPKIEAAFQGIRPAIVALIAYAAFGIGKKSIVDKTTLGTALLSLVFLLLGLHPVLVIALGAVSGVVLVYAKERFGHRVSLDRNRIVTAELICADAPEYMNGEGI